MSTGETGSNGLWVLAWDDEGIAGTLAGTPGQAYAGGIPFGQHGPRLPVRVPVPGVGAWLKGSTKKRGGRYV